MNYECFPVVKEEDTYPLDNPQIKTVLEHGFFKSLITEFFKILTIFCINHKKKQITL